MPLIEIKNPDAPIAVVRCAICKTTSEHALASLQLGVEHAHGVNEDAILLPPCVCGAQETIFRTHDITDGLPVGHRHAVNAVAAHLKANGYAHPLAFPALRAEKVRPQHIRPLIGPV